MDLIKAIRDKQAKIGIIGLGYVGLPLVIRFCEEDFNVTGFDIDPKKVARLNRGESYIKHIPSEKIKSLKKKKLFEATSDYSKLKDADCIIICVPTPLKKNREPDLSYVEKTSYEIARYLRKGHLVSLESTTYPGTTREILLTKFENNGLKAGKDFYLVFSPEREDPGNPKFNTKNIPKVVGGITPQCRKAGEALYSQIVDRVVSVSSTEVAEFTKLLENIFRSVNIALVNELKLLADRMGIDVWEVIEASSTKPFGFMPFYPGPGLGGHCIPIDPFYLSWKAKEYDFNTRFIELAGEVNTGMPDYVVSKITDCLNKTGKCLKNSRILILGVGYKKDTDDIRESPAVEIIEMLKNKGARVDYNDPFIPSFSGMRHYPHLTMKSVQLTGKNLKKYDCTVIITNHSKYDYDWLLKNSRLVVDTRNATKGLRNSRIIKA
ncbi:MAG: nucleotide sugar dehydrogenase [Nitrospirae bacterium]|nr:nucleotide sugar dehydrogenase [Nitrospirota bacterium]